MRDRGVPILALAATAAVVPPALLHFIGRNKVLIGGWIHFGVWQSAPGWQLRVRSP